MAEDYYKILGVDKKASQDEIKKAYRKLAIQNHPDKHPDEKDKYEAKFKEINEAYSVLSDTQKRAQYDQFGSAGGTGGGGFGSGFGGFGNGGFSQHFQQGGFDFDFDNINDIFNSFFHGGNRSRSSAPKERDTSGADLKYKMDITLEDAFNCATKYAEYHTLGRCSHCNGTGSATGKKENTTCQKCKGHGSVRMQQGFFIVEQECPECEGTGQIIKSPCKYCNGSGVENITKKVEVKIPAGISDGDTIKIVGEGEAGECGGEFGDLYVVFKIKQHKIFKKNGSNLDCTIPIRFTQAALGATITILGIDKKNVSFDIPEGIQNGEQIVVRGEGMPNRNGRRGDLFITIQVETPVKLTDEQRDLLERFEQSCNAKTNPKSESFFESIKNFFN